MLALRAKSCFRSIAAAVGLSVFAGAAPAQTVLTYSPWLPPAHALNDAVRPWMKEVERVTEGRVKVEWRAAAVGAAREQFDVVRDGLVDLSVISVGYTPGRFPLLALGELPFLSSDMRIAAPAFDRLYRKTLAGASPVPGIHVLSTYTTLPAHVFNSKRLIRDVSDFKGLKLRTANSTAADIVDSLGAVPIQKSATEFYELVSAGVIDGGITEPQTVVNVGVEQYVKYVTFVPGGLGQSVMALIVNEKKWNSLSEKDRAAIMGISAEKFALAAANAFESFNDVAIAKMREKGAVVEEMQPALAAKVTAKLKAADEKWFAMAKKAGLANPEAVLAGFRAELRAEEAKAGQAR